MEKSHTLTLSISKLIKNLDFKPIATKPNAIYHDYTGVSFKSIFSIEGSCPCDVFISIHKGKHTRIIKENDIVDHLRLMKYQKKGIRQLYIRRSDRRKFVSYSANILDQFIADDFSKLNSAQIILDELVQQTLREIYRDGILDEESISSAFVIVYGYQKMLDVSIRSIAYLLQLAKEKPDYVRHSVYTSIFSILLANAIPNTPANVITLAGLGGLLHDIGMIKIPLNINELNPHLSLKEQIQLERHPQLGVDLLEQAFNCPKGLKKVIRDHHERWDGSGYPNNLSGENINYVARMVSIADYFNSIHRLKYKGKTISPSRIISMMREKNWFDPYLLDTFARLLRV